MELYINAIILVEIADKEQYEIMTLYHYDLHVHTSNVSPCAHVQAEEVVRLYAQAGYTGIVITDHYYDRFFSAWNRCPGATRSPGTWKDITWLKGRGETRRRCLSRG